MSASGASVVVEELRSRLTIKMDDSKKTEINKQLLPDLLTLTMLRPRMDQHSAVKKLFKWMLDPQRSADEFLYVIGPLGKSAWDIMEDINYGYYIQYKNIGYSMYLAKVAAEALAVQCPILDGPWEHVMWLVLAFFGSYRTDIYGFPSDCLSAWIIRVIGDSNLCPIPHLRIDLIHLLIKIVDINDHNRVLALQSVMSACSNLNMEHNKKCRYGMNPSTISKILKMFSKDLLEFDKILSEKLQEVKGLRLSAILYDVSYAQRMNTNIYSEPAELHGLTALLKTTAGYAKIKCETLEEVLYLPGFRLLLLEISGTLRFLIGTFSNSCQMPQLIGVTASCIMGILELVLLSTVVHGHWLYPALFECEQLLKELCNLGKFFDWFLDIHRIDNSPVVQEIIRKNYSRLNDIRLKLESLNVDDFNLKEFYPMIYILLNSHKYSFKCNMS